MKRNRSLGLVLVCFLCTLCGLLRPERVAAQTSLDPARQQAALFLEALQKAFAEEPLLEGDAYWKKMPDYFAELRNLSSLLDQSGLASLRASESGDAVSEILLVADEVTHRPERFNLLLEWYGRTREEVPVEFLRTHLQEGRERDKLIADRDPHRPMANITSAAAPKPYWLRTEHLSPEYRLAWEALLLSRNDKGGSNYDLRVRIFEAFAKMKDPKTLPLLSEYLSICLAANPQRWYHPSSRQYFERALEAVGTIGGAEVVDVCLKCLAFADSRGRTELAEGKSGYSVRQLILRQLAGRDSGFHRRYEAAMEERISANQKDPQGHPLTDIQINVLTEALRRAATAKKDEPAGSSGVGKDRP